jgi:hypothetical protein
MRRAVLLVSRLGPFDGMAWIKARVSKDCQAEMFLMRRGSQFLLRRVFESAVIGKDLLMRLRPYVAY